MRDAIQQRVFRTSLWPFVRRLDRQVFARNTVNTGARLSALGGVMAEPTFQFGSCFSDMPRQHIFGNAVVAWNLAQFCHATRKCAWRSGKNVFFGRPFLRLFVFWCLQNGKCRTNICAFEWVTWINLRATQKMLAAAVGIVIRPDLCCRCDKQKITFPVHSKVARKRTFGPWLWQVRFVSHERLQIKTLGLRKMFFLERAICLVWGAFRVVTSENGTSDLFGKNAGPLNQIITDHRGLPLWWGWFLPFRFARRRRTNEPYVPDFLMFAGRLAKGKPPHKNKQTKKSNNPF